MRGTGGHAYVLISLPCNLLTIALTLCSLQVSHAIDQECRHKGAPDFILVGEAEMAGMPWGGDRYLTAYSCMRCPLLIMNNYGNIEWRGLDAIKDHINQE